LQHNACQNHIAAALALQQQDVTTKLQHMSV
jgi:hypothetical protein